MRRRLRPRQDKVCYILWHRRRGAVLFPADRPTGYNLWCLILAIARVDPNVDRAPERLFANVALSSPVSLRRARPGNTPSKRAIAMQPTPSLATEFRERTHCAASYERRCETRARRGADGPNADAESTGGQKEHNARGAKPQAPLCDRRANASRGGLLQAFRFGAARVPRP